MSAVNLFVSRPFTLNTFKVVEKEPNRAHHIVCKIDTNTVHSYPESLTWHKEPTQLFLAKPGGCSCKYAYPTFIISILQYVFFIPCILQFIFVIVKGQSPFSKLFITAFD